ncbi:YihY/virulence factor BrkB family protein [Halomonas sp. McH1-25]|uniref:YihY/virulence factor BrkB family protein n=1 Tax=unclassified Halomonas TaxID=2609666 RepID=UPI001EF70B6F|nr:MULTISPECIES: YihY/virulence factor BrkB family protein [unclassified Halomonas]MCG7600030.1 YihY/virulence factor BrkB family protein [Halomonas sp. McH1-25]MCP1344125.1 YihY/virulence factor BrkB family protein [Halomonas sp. FL8]MCP1362240.1 YihY/virulence factor BrkB family protein [Halomonas sp. BBD45]
MANRKSAASHGRHAHKPTQIPKPGWKAVLKRSKEEMSRDHVSMVAAGIAFYGLLAIVPAIVATISLWALLFDPQQITQQISSISHLLPEEAANIIRQQAQQASQGAGAGMSLAAIGGLLLAIYSSSRGVDGFMEGLNIIYDEEESRGMLKRTAIKLVLTIGAILMTIVTLGVITAIPAIVNILGLPSLIGTLINLARWPLLMIVVMLAIAILYRYGPDREQPRWQWVSVGSALAVLLWVVGSIAFSIYVRNFASYNETYGSLGAVVILLMWFWLSAFIVLMGAELNSEMERQTQHDTTTGDERPMGERGAYAADSVAKDDH